MWSWIFKVSIVSFLFIFLLHYLYSFFKITLTSPKIKDLVNKPMRKYDSIYDSLQNNQSYIEETEGVNISNSLHSNSLSTQNPVKQNMKDELKKYLSELSGSGGNSYLFSWFAIPSSLAHISTNILKFCILYPHSALLQNPSYFLNLHFFANSSGVIASFFISDSLISPFFSTTNNVIVCFSFVLVDSDFFGGILLYYTLVIDTYLL